MACGRSAESDVIAGHNRYIDIYIMFLPKTGFLCGQMNFAAAIINRLFPAFCPNKIDDNNKLRSIRQ
jgi:hypothetical protein